MVCPLEWRNTVTKSNRKKILYIWIHEEEKKQTDLGRGDSLEAVIGNILILDRVPKIGINEMFEQINTRGAEREGQVDSWHQRKNLTGEGQ